ncbi:hypothetical protein ACFWNK_34095 [Streptomyces sp. NPDC058417]|uniref:hypothetical protein n=1 Tax=unclassified Streptomyces TaxID=2593676 RepID=UPI00365DAE7B
MSFLSSIGLIETEQQERARLAQAPEGSTNHYLSTLPVTIEEWPKDLLIELPWEPPRTDRPYRVVVVPIEFRKDLLPEGVEEEPLPRKRHSGSWTCAVVFSDHPIYPVGGFRIDVPAAEIARCRKVDLAGYRARLPSETSRPESPSRGHPYAASGAPKTAADRKISEAP